MATANTSNPVLPPEAQSGLSMNTVVLMLLAVFIVYWGKDDLLALTGSSNKKQKTGAAATQKAPARAEEDNPDDFVTKMKEGNKRAAFFFGSQTGTAHEYAVRLAKEGKSRYGFSSLVLDPEEYELTSLDRVPEDKAVIFVMATYGDGEPTDNAEGMMSFLLDDDVTFSGGGNTLENLNYVIFGLGNRSYSKYQAMSRSLDKRLQELGATRIGVRGETDELEGTEKAFLEWKDSMWVQFGETLGIMEGDEVDMADFTVQDTPGIQENTIYRGELSPHALKVATATGPAPHAAVYDGKNPYTSPVVVSRELFAPNAERNCIHLEFDISGTNISYSHGDHVGVWPSNPDMAVERLIGALGLKEKRHEPINVTALDPGLVGVPFPNPTTYDAVIRYYLEISAVASRQTLQMLSRYAPNPRAKAALERWGRDAAAYSTEIESSRVRLGEALQLAAGDDLRDTTKTTVWSIPFDRIISVIPRQKPRWYSISSSPKMTPNAISATAVVLKYETPEAKLYDNNKRWIFGVATSYILNVNNMFNGTQPVEKCYEGIPTTTPTYHVPGARDVCTKNNLVHVPIHVRRATFRLPTRTNVPIIMVGPGTGIAPFRGFVQERVALARQAKERKGPDALKDWAPMYLFYGCRREEDDFLYKNEWPQYAAELDNKLHMEVAFSRGPQRNADGSKIYVQTLLWNNRETLAKAIVDQGAFIYICGEGQNMGKQVEETFAKMIAEYEGKPAADGVKSLEILKERKRFLTDTWS